MANLKAHLLTFKEGLLARFAHDLRFAVGDLRIELRGGEVSARMSVASLVVEGAVERGKLNTQALSSDDRAQVERTLRETVLDAGRYPEVCFDGRAHVEGGRAWVEGELRLRGQARSIKVPVAVAPNVLRATVAIKPSQWGIAPYRAMAGALKLRDEVRLELELAAEVPGLSYPDLGTSDCAWHT